MTDDARAAAPRSSTHLGIDVGGTFIKWAIVARSGDERRSGDDGPSDEGWQAIDHDQVATHADGGPDAVLSRLGDVATEVLSRHPGAVTIGIGVPGPYDPRAGMVRDLTNFPGDWTDKPVAQVVESRSGLPVHLINDGRAFGLAELRLGAGRGANTIVGLTLGTGLGGVICVDGDVYQGHDGSAGELGHQTIVADGPSCNCGNNGCLEAFMRADRLADACGASSMEEALTRAGAHDARALAGLAEAGRYLGIGLANVVTLVTPDLVVVGGGNAAALDFMLPHVWEEMRRRVFMTSLDQVRIVRAELGVWAGAIGAAIHGAQAAAGD